MAYCRKCRTRIDDEAVICPNCGVPQQSKDMAYCRKCGKQIDGEAVICSHCGVPQKDLQQSSAPIVEDRKAKGDEIALAVLIPIVGLILGIVYYSKGMKKAGTTLISVSVILSVVIFIAYEIMAGFAVF